MAGKTVTVGCRLPHGLTIHHPMRPDLKVTLRGLNSAVIIGADHVTTQVDAEFWEDWKKANKDFTPFTSGAIFEAKNAADAEAIAEELKAERTGLEPMQTDGKDPRAAGVKVADSKSDE